MVGSLDPKVKVKMPPGFLAGFDLVDGRPEYSKTKTLKQVHSADGSYADAEIKDLREGDWLWTDKTNCRIGVMVADCTAALVWGQSRSHGTVVAAIHAGWRGTAKGIFEKAIGSLEFEKFSVWLSPSICQEHFEVGEEVIEALGIKAKNFAKPGKSQKFFLDLKAFQTQQLRDLGGEVVGSSLCNFCQPDFVSYRRSEGRETKRHLAWIERNSL